MAELKKSTILKLRQEEADQVVTNGSYNIVLNGPPVLLEEGDTCAIKTAIIDSTVESTIIIDEDMRAEIGVAKYLRNATGPAGDLGLRQFTVKDAPNTGATADGLMWVLGEGQTSTSNDYLIEKITVFPQHKNGVHDMGFITLNYRYTDISGNSQVWSHYMKGRIQQNHPDGFDIPVNIASKFGQFTWISNANLHDYKISSISVTKAASPVVAGEYWMHPTINYVQIDIAKGRYTPGEIATIVTDALSDRGSGAKQGTNFFPVDGDVLTTFWQHKLELAARTPPSDQFLCPPRSPFEHPDDGWNNISSVMMGTWNSYPSNRYIGTNEISLTYDTNLKKLAWDIMHFPIYVTDPGAAAGAPAIPGIEFDGVNAMSSYSGVFFTSMTPDTFWNKQLGMPSMVAQWTQQQDKMQINGVDYYPFFIEPMEGVNTTSVFNGLDLVVNHVTAYSTPPETAGHPIPASIPPVATGLTLPIIADREFDVANNDEGYYLIEIGFKFPQKMIGGSNGSIGARNNNKVQSIMGKYFTSGQFLQDTGQGSIVYQHQGEPQMITELTVAIRRPDGSIPDVTEIGPSNSIFMEIAKTIVAGPPPAP